MQKVLQCQIKGFSYTKKASQYQIIESFYAQKCHNHIIFKSIESFKLIVTISKQRIQLDGEVSKSENNLGVKVCHLKRVVTGVPLPDTETTVWCPRRARRTARGEAPNGTYPSYGPIQ